LARPVLADTSPIVIGYPAALTGPSSAPGVGNNRGVMFAVDAINAAGGVKGRKIEVVTRDTQGDPTKAVNAVQEMMASYTVHAIWGPNNSGESLATTPIITRRGIPNIHSCGITSLIDAKKYPNAYRISPNNSQAAEPPRAYCQGILKVNDVAVIGDSTGFGTMMDCTDAECARRYGVGRPICGSPGDGIRRGGLSKRSTLQAVSTVARWS
jgi:branched-chain amino acid transport system substrate-binding protein